MKHLTTFLFVALIAVIAIGCSSSSSSNPEQETDQIVASDVGLEAGGDEFGTPISREALREKIMNLDYVYDVIVTDVDGWDIVLWQVRHRANRDVVTYRGLLVYSSGYNLYEGTAAGIWDYDNNIFACTALDSSWNGGHINYDMPFQGYSSEGQPWLRGPYYYLENPNRVNRIDAWVTAGTLPYLDPGKQQPRLSREELADYLCRTEGRREKDFGDE
ncbi:hypothetical protein KQI63_08335 [bacterium]|nr:hypothetical protein [bacterium]